MGFLKEQLVLKDSYFREEIVFLRNKLDIALSNFQDSSSIDYKEDVNTIYHIRFPSTKPDGDRDKYNTRYMRPNVSHS